MEQSSKEITINNLSDLMGDLRAIAINLLANEQSVSLRPSDLVQTGLRRYKVSDQSWDEIAWNDRNHFFRCAALMMRRALIDHARRRKARPVLKGEATVDFDLYNIPIAVEQTPEKVVALDEAIEWLDEYDSELCQIVQYHYYFGSSVKELSVLLEQSERTTKRRLNAARVLLKKKIDELCD